MTFRFAEAFVGYAAINDTADSGWSNAGGCSYANNTGRFGLGGVTSGHGSTFTRGITRVAAATTDAVIVQFAAKFATGTRSNACTILRLKNNGGANDCFYLKRTPSDAVQVLDASAVIIGTSAGAILTPGGWHVIVVKATIGDGATGSVDVYVNDMNVPVLSLSGKDLNGAGAANGCDFVQFEEGPGGDNVAGQIWTLSELIIYDTEDTMPWNDLIGDKRLYLIETVADSSVEWTRNGGATNFSRVGATVDPLTGTHDGDGTYNSSAVNGDADLFTATNLPTGVVGIVGVISVLTAKKADGGTEVEFFHHGESNAVPWSASTGALSTSYKNYQFNKLKNPDGDVDWAETTVNAMLIGYKSAEPA